MLDAAIREWFPIIVAAVLIGLAWLYQWYRSRPVRDLPEGTPYKVYTTEYDIEIRAEDIAGRLSEISRDHPKYWQDEVDPEWVANVENSKLKAKDLLEAGLITDMLDDLSDFAISLLVDHSGSMRGEPMIGIAATVGALTEVLSDKRAKVELLGYTTAGWKGGFARGKWLASGKPKYPGRLCAVMHIIYKAADDQKLNEAAFYAMQNLGTLYENIDGEAIEWAERRLLERPEKHRLLVVISDGAPVDDSTLTQNGPSILWRHIKKVIGRIETEKSVVLCGIGINYRVDEFYANSVSVEDVSKLPEIAFTFLKKMIFDQRR